MEVEIRAEAMSIQTFVNITLITGFILGLYVGSLVTYTLTKIL